MRAGDSVECRTTHLTSFAVLVNTQGSTTTSSESVIVYLEKLSVLVIVLLFRLCLLSAMLAAVYQLFVCF